MKTRIYLLLFTLGLGVASLVAVFQHAPGYMDADYYYAGGLELATGKGFRESFLWNYLDDPPGLPRASHAYWMPLASMLTAAGIWVSGLPNFTGARIGFLLVAACLPPLTAALTFSLTRRRNHALLAGFLAVVPVYYLPVISTTDNFGLYMLLGGAWFLVAGSKRTFWLGIIAGLMHLARADGLLWLGISALAVLFPGSQSRGTPAGDPLEKTKGHNPAQAPGFNPGLAWFRHSVLRLAQLMLGYLVIMGPWMLRNLAEFGTLLAPGASRAVWVARYDELYAFPASILTPAHWWATGLGPILQARGEALGQNLVRAFAVQGSIFLTPLILLGLWRLREDRRVQLGALSWALTLFAMTAIFPHQGWRGGFFHSGAAVQTLLWALVPTGLEGFISWGVRKRGWIQKDAQTVFGVGLVALGVLLSVLVVRGQVIGKDFLAPTWGESDRVYRELETSLRAAGAAPGQIVAVNNPAGYYIAAGRPAVVIPDGDESVLLAAANRYHARFILLEYNHPRGLDPLYQNPAGRPGLKYLDTISGTHLFKVP